jgi:hypothetical protein
MVDFLEPTRVTAVTVESTPVEKKLGSRTWSAVGRGCAVVCVSGSEFGEERWSGVFFG